MPKYVLGYHGGGMPETEEEQQKVMAAWGAWLEGMGDACLDPGAPVGATKTVAPGGSVSDDGGANPLSGYGLIEAADIDAAVKIASGCPILDAGGTVEVAETFQPPGM